MAHAGLKLVLIGGLAGAVLTTVLGCFGFELFNTLFNEHSQRTGIWFPGRVAPTSLQEKQLVGASEDFSSASRAKNNADKPLLTRVDADVLITGMGGAFNSGTVVFNEQNNSIIYAGSTDSAPNIKVNRTIKVKAVMPGLWDCHTHFMGDISEKSSFKAKGLLEAQFPVNYIKFHSALTELEQAVMMGITSVREVGGLFGQAISDLEKSGQIVAPNFHYAGRAIGITSGHTDDQLLPLDEYRRMDQRQVSGGALCDGVPECLKKMRENLRMQADVIKIMTTGGVLSEFDQPIDAELSLEEIKAIVQDAKRARRAVAAHAHGTEGIQNAIDGGVTSIEHGSYMTREQARQIKAKGYMVYTPTATIQQLFFNGTERPAGLDDNQWRKGQETLRHAMHSLRMAIEEEVPIVAGTDCPYGCAMVAREINYFHMFGMTPINAIKAATGDAPRCMGQFGMMPKSGRLSAGFEADVIALDVNPLEQLEALMQYDHITYVWKGGKLMKSPSTSRTLHETVVHMTSA